MWTLLQAKPWTALRVLRRASRSGDADRLDTRKRDKQDNDREKDEAGVRRAESEPAVFARLRQKVPKRGAQRPGQDVSQPECKHRIGAEVEIGGGDCGDQPAENDDADVETKAQGLRRQVARGGAQREREQDGGPVEELAPGCDDRVDRQGT